MNKTKIALRYERAIVLERSTTLVGTYQHSSAVASICADMMQLGFTPSESLLHELRRRESEDELTTIYNELIPELQHMVGDDVEYAPMYPNFPQQVMEASDAVS